MAKFGQRQHSRIRARPSYEFTDLDALLADFERDVTKGGTSNESHHRSWQQRDRIQGRTGTNAQKERGRAPYYRLSFESARTLFAELTPARLDLLNTLRGMGPASVYALAKTAGRNYSNVHADVARLVELGLIERTDDGMVTVPFDAVEIRMALARAA